MASDIKLNDNGVVVEGGELHNAGPGGGYSFADRTKGAPQRWVLYASDGKARVWSQQAGGDKLTIQANGHVGVNTQSPVRPLHVEGGEVHSGGSAGGFSFSDRAKPAFVDNPQNGERWVWYAHDGAARLWSGRDVLVVEDDGSRPGSLPQLRIDGDVHVGGKLSGGNISRLEGTEVSTDPIRIRKIAIYANVLAFDGSTGKTEKYGLFTDFADGKEVLVLNVPADRTNKHFKDGVRVEGNLQVTGALSQASSIALKENVAALTGDEAMATLEGLNAVKFTYKADETKAQRIGFIAEEVPDLVAAPERDRLSPMDLLAVLTKAMQEQQRTIADLVSEVRTLKPRA